MKLLLSSAFSPRKVTWLGLLVNAVLSTGKIVSGVIFSSQAIVADGFHSLSDLASDLAVLWGLHVSWQPADEDHHFGHFRASTAAAFFVGLMLFLAALWIGAEAILTIRERHTEIRPLVPLLWAITSIALKEWLYRITREVGLRCKDLSLQANAWHHRTDAFTSVAAALGLGGIMVGGDDWAFLDHVVAAGLAGYLCFVACRIIRDALREFMDRAPDPKVMETIKKAVAGTPGVKGFHAVRARHIGGRICMDIHLLVDPEITVRHGHDIAEDVERRIRASSADVVDIVVHVEPSE